MSARRNHWLAAGVIGTFGDQTSGVGRDARIAVRRKTTGKVVIAKASSVAYERGLYTLTNPPSGLQSNTVDEVLGTLEPALPQAIAALEQRQDNVEVHEFLMDYVATLATRHPVHFQNVADDYQARHGANPLVGDALEITRLHALQNAISQVRTWHWRVIERPRDARRFVLNDLGFGYLGQQDREGRAVFVPLSPQVAILGFMGDRQSFASRHVATPLTIDWLNALSWTEATREVYGHPDDRLWLATLADPSLLPVNRTGPYRWTRRNLLDE